MVESQVGEAAPMLIGELAQRAGVHVQTVRYYERRGLLPNPSRTPAGYRQYSGDALDRLRFIRRAQDLGFTLSEIADLLRLRLDARTRAETVKRRARAKVDDIDRRLRDLEHIKRALVHLAGRCRGGSGPVGACPFLDALGELGPVAVGARTLGDDRAPGAAREASDETTYRTTRAAGRAVPPRRA